MGRSPLRCRADAMSNEEKAVNLARLLIEACNHPDDEALQQRYIAELHRADPVTLRLSAAAQKLLEGKGYGVSTDNPETVHEFRALANYMGATVTETVSDWPIPDDCVSFRLDLPRS
jgi:hypothetical protein